MPTVFPASGLVLGGRLVVLDGRLVALGVGPLVAGGPSAPRLAAVLAGRVAGLADPALEAAQAEVRSAAAATTGTR